ncbi:MAG: hypothetical protein AB1430_01050 [Pseudomonadota bacterium]
MCTRDLMRGAAALLGMLCAMAHAGGMQAMADDELAGVSGSDGLAFNLVGFSLQGPLTLTYTSPDGASLGLSNLSLSRSDDPAATFSDPYRLRVLSRGNGLADVIALTGPANANGLLKWQFAADWNVVANGIDHQGGALMISDLVSRNASLTLTTPAGSGVEGVAFGLGLDLQIGQLLLRPRGRGVETEQLGFSGIRLGAAAEDGTLLGTPWHLADATHQPGIFNAVTDANGVSSLHLGIGWPTGSSGAPIGSLVIDNIAFRSDALPGGQLDLGSSRIGTMQVQYLDVKLRGGF